MGQELTNLTEMQAENEALWPWLTSTTPKLSDFKVSELPPLGWSAREVMALNQSAVRMARERGQRDTERVMQQSEKMLGQCCGLVVGLCVCLVLAMSFASSAVRQSQRQSVVIAEQRAVIRQMQQDRRAPSGALNVVLVKGAGK